MSRCMFPSEASLSHTACAVVGMAFTVLLGLILWLIVDVEMPLIATHLHT